MKKYIILLLVTAVGFSQNINEYKYAMVPAKFSFLKDENMYNLNILSKMYMEKYGFETYLDSDILPADFARSNCNKIFIDVVNSSSVFVTKLKVIIKNCSNTIIATSDIGTSNEKEYKVAYTQALRKAFDSFTVLKEHKYQPSEKSLGMIGEPAQTVVSKKKEDVLQEEINFKKETATGHMNVKQYNVVATKNGFNLITAVSDHKIFEIFKTSSNDVFIANRDNVMGVLIKKTDNWFFEYYDGNILKSELIKVDF